MVSSHGDAKFSECYSSFFNKVIFRILVRAACACINTNFSRFAKSLLLSCCLYREGLLELLEQPKCRLQQECHM